MKISTLLLFLVYSMTVVAQTAPPILLSPSEDAVMDNGCTDRSDSIDWDFQWTAVSGATDYHVQVKRNKAPIAAVRERTNETTYALRQAGSYIVPPNYSNWRWRVRALVDNKWTDWSEERTFSVEPLDTDCRK